MKKTVTANIAGTVFHVEEDAYEQLQRYLAGIRANFSGSAGAEDIMSDIEARIAELFTERMVGRNVVSIADIQHVESVMGRPEDFAGENDGGSTTSSGPTAPTGKAQRRFLRDTDDKWVGGVIGGLAAYINTEAIWLRIAFIAVVWLGWGSPILVYLLLWILVPKATTAAEKLQMRGEAVTVDNLKRMFEEGTEKVKQGAERVATEAKDLGKEWGPRSQQWGQEAGGAARRVGSSAASVIGKIIGIGLILFAFSMLLGLITFVVGGSWTFWNASWNNDELGLLDLGGIVFTSKAHAMWFGIGAIVLLVVPIIALFLAGFKLLLGTSTPKWLGIGLAVLWFSALVPTILTALDLGNDFRRQNKMRTEVSISQPLGNTIYLDGLVTPDSNLNWSMTFDDGDMDFDLNGLHIENDHVSGNWGDCDVTRSADSLYHFMVVREANARSAKLALGRAERVEYNYKQDGDVLFISPLVRFSKEDKWRAQDVRFILEVPDGKSVFFREGCKNIIYDIDNTTNTLDRDMLGKTWTMTPAGLKLGSSTEPTPATTDSTRTNNRDRRVVYHKAPSAPRTTEVVTDEATENVQLPNVFRLLSRSLHI
ncbi:MAG: PspC domain-containing protein [Flavobacteriales bacterium]|nr:PspC domain-containing protein [Flavobacteriales bacterium]